METRELAVTLLWTEVPLKPSLVEWKQGPFYHGQELCSALKPSLVEWKLYLDEQSGNDDRNLETFLSGMETKDLGEMVETTASTLKPSLVEWKQAMRNEFVSEVTSLKPSLVEWKPM